MLVSSLMQDYWSNLHRLGLGAFVHSPVSFQCCLGCIAPLFMVAKVLARKLYQLPSGQQHRREIMESITQHSVFLKRLQYLPFI